MRYFTLASGAHTTLRLSGFPPLSGVPFSLTVYSAGLVVLAAATLLTVRLRRRVSTTIAKSITNAAALAAVEHLNGVQLDFSRLGKPTDNAMIEAFNARFRVECLNESWFVSLEDTREKI